MQVRVYMCAYVEARGQPVAQVLPVFCFDIGSLTGVDVLQLASLGGSRADLSAFLAQGLPMWAVPCVFHVSFDLSSSL